MMYQDWLDDFAMKLENKMNEKGITMAELAERAEVSQATISRYLNGLQQPSLSSLVNIANVLGCSVKDLSETNGHITRIRRQHEQSCTRSYS